MLFAVVVVGRPPLWVILMGFAFIIGEILSGKSNGIPVDFLIAAQPPIPCVHTQAHHSMTTLWIIRRRHILTGNYLITTVQVHSVQCQDVITALWSLMDRLCHGPSISLSSRSVTLFPGAPCRQFINERLPWIDRSSPFSLHWLIDDWSRRGALTNVHWWVLKLLFARQCTHMTQYVNDVSCARIVVALVLQN